MEETKFILHGEHHRPNGWVMRDALSYLAHTEEEAVATCNRNQPQFHIHSITKEID